MDRSFFIRLTFAAHRVADALQEEEVKREIKNAADSVLVDLLLFSDKENVPKEKKRDLIAQILKDMENLGASLDRAKQAGGVRAENFSVLETEYGKIRYMLQIFEGVEEPIAEARRTRPAARAKEEIGAPAVTLPSGQAGGQEVPRQEQRGITERQRSILEFLKAKKKVQVWELQKILPQVTKRTLRRDLDDLLQMNIIERKGEWNAVFYELKETA